MDNSNSFLMQLARMVGAPPTQGRVAPTPQMLGSGMANNAGQSLALREAYNKYAIAAQENGDEVVPFPQFIQHAQSFAAQQGQQPQQPNAMAGRGLSY